MSWATCQWNLAEGDKSCWTVIYLPSTDSHTNQCTLVLTKLWLSKHLFPLQQWWKQLQPAWTWIHWSDLCGLKVYRLSLDSIQYSVCTTGQQHMVPFYRSITPMVCFLGSKPWWNIYLYICLLHFSLYLYVWFSLFWQLREESKQIWHLTLANMMDLSSLTLSLFLVFVPGKNTNINKCWIWACIYRRFQSRPDSNFALSLFCSSSFSDLALLAIKCQHLFPYANIITCYRISAHTWFGLHSH